MPSLKSNMCVAQSASRLLHRGQCRTKAPRYHLEQRWLRGITLDSKMLDRPELVRMTLLSGAAVIALLTLLTLATLPLAHSPHRPCAGPSWYNDGTLASQGIHLGPRIALVWP